MGTSLIITRTLKNPAENFEGFWPGRVIPDDPTNMKSFKISLLLVCAALLAYPAATHAAASGKKKKADAAQKADNYPLKTCVVSGEPLGSMGESVQYMHKEAGKPDRLVRFCCEGCIDDFKKEPAKFLKKIDDAAAKPAAKN
jgi:hypothetical protein